MATELFKHKAKIDADKYSISRQGTDIKLKENDKEVAVVFVDATDNRLTLKSIDETVDEAGITKLTAYLDLNFGAKQIFSVPPALQEKFKTCGFKFVEPENKMKDRLRETSFKSLSEISVSAEAFPGLECIHGESVKNTTEDNIMTLAKGSNFLLSKITQYTEQGYPGFRLMCDYSHPFGVVDQKGKLVAFCRVTTLGNGNYYLSDTFVDESVFGTKPQGTAFLYKQVGNHYQTGDVFLIAPPDRVDEFDSQYGCHPSQKAMFKFNAPKPELQQTFEEEKARIEQLITAEKSPKISSPGMY